ncbi:MAG: Na+/H+ antiporter subunit E [Actinomycetaceae bacterium]|nr:Na+/H+ antiporter subunit E [Actinomycetaceae bacterium]
MFTEKFVLYLRRISIFITLCMWGLWMLLFASFDLLTIISGFLVALLVQIAFPLPHSGYFRRIRLLPSLWLMVYFVWEVVLAAWVISLQVFRVVFAKLGWVSDARAQMDSKVIVVPLQCAEDIVLSMTAAMINLIPGTIVLELDTSPATLTLHVFDLGRQGGEAAVIQAVQAQEARILRCFANWEELAC